MVQDKPTFTRPLRYQLLAGCALILLFTSAIAIVFTRQQLQEKSRINITRRAQRLTEGLEFAAEGLVETNDVYCLNRLVQNYAAWPNVQKISIIDPNGVIIAHGEGIKMAREKKYAQLAPALFPIFEQVSISGIPQSLITKIDGEEVVVYALPFNTYSFPEEGESSDDQNTHRRGVAITVLAKQELNREVNQALLLVVASFVIGTVVIVLLLGLLIRYSVLAPLGKLHRALINYDNVEQFSLPSLPSNEIGFLGQTLVQTFNQLQVYQREALEIAERKYVEIAQRYELASQATRVWVWEYQPQMHYIEADPNLIAWLGFKQSLEQEDDDFFIHPDDRPEFWQAIEQGLADPTAELSAELRLETADGEIYYCLLRGQIHQEADPVFTRIIGTIADITEIKKAEEQLKFSNKILAKATQLKDEFLANMSHELRTPLNSILGMAEALQNQFYGPLNGKQIQSLEAVERSGKHLLSLINDILDLSKIEAGKMELDLEPTNLPTLVNHSLTFVQHFALQKRVNLSFKILPNLPDVVVDKRRICQVLINLLNNAVKFTPEGGKVTLQVNLFMEEGAPNHHGQLPQLQITVIDTGIGIATERLGSIFEPFVQIDGALNRRYDGTGLGLSLVRKIVELHGGSVNVTSELDRGSQFLVVIPCLLQDDVGQFHQDELFKVSSIDNLIPTTITLISENSAYATTLSSYFRARGYQMQWLNCSFPTMAQLTALQQSVNQSSHLLVMDLPQVTNATKQTLDEIRDFLGADSVTIVALIDAMDYADGDTVQAEIAADQFLVRPVRFHRLMEIFLQHSQAIAPNPPWS
ncbi:HAMP domain-containing sensor histidine kinase [Synechocystis sp. PCC 7338]|uniref:sensor histidine kinase n=2 Tax=unclassified Synechocystis TaxID=2640012 RepID=UPI001BB02A23|nr:PAS domain-containing hybrid sensor histidine kinase/response regulator [Synechocystis sp. PCC 7338]QUS60914.1 PAS domain-containing protein [Synechocystis sp. PCC 7338]